MRGREHGTAEQRNALAPGLVAAAVLLLAPALERVGLSMVVFFTTSILALVVAVFCLRARQWWWLIVLIPIAAAWNPVVVLPLAGPVWAAAHWVAAASFVVIGVVATEQASDR